METESTLKEVLSTLKVAAGVKSVMLRPNADRGEWVLFSSDAIIPDYYLDKTVVRFWWDGFKFEGELQTDDEST